MGQDVGDVPLLRIGRLELIDVQGSTIERSRATDRCSAASRSLIDGIPAPERAAIPGGWGAEPD